MTRSSPHIRKARRLRTGRAPEALTEGSSEGYVSVDRGLAVDVARSPADSYVNVHDDYPGGAVGGQLGD